MVAGLAAGAAWSVTWVWLVGATVCAVVMFAWSRSNRPRTCPRNRPRNRPRPRAVASWGWLAFILLSAAYMSVREHRVPMHSIERYLGTVPALQRVQGVIEGPSKIASPRRGHFGDFTYKKPDTFFVLRVERIAVAVSADEDTPDDGLRPGLDWSPAAGRLLCRIDEAEPNLIPGQRIEAAGWAASFRGPVNPGEKDFRAAMKQRGIAGRITLQNRNNWHPVHATPRSASGALGAAADWGNACFDQFDRLRQAFAHAAGHALAIGMRGDPEVLALLNRVVLGQSSEELSDLEGEFKRVGMAHLLAISGAHLGVLLGLTWLLLKVLGVSPSQSCVLVLALLGLYLLAVPVRVPVARSALMAVLLLGGYALGRGPSAEHRLAAAMILVLMWRPADLFDAGFQLSFVTVWALIRYTPTVSQWLWPKPPLEPVELGVRKLMRSVVDAQAVSIVAFAAAGPIVAYHFQLISPLAAALSFAALPVFVGLLGIGYVKALVGIALPTLSWWLAEPLLWFGRALAFLVRKVDQLPGSSVELATRPSAWWIVAILAMGAALGQGWLRGRRLAPLCAAGLIVLCMAMEQQPHIVAFLRGKPQPAIRLYTFSVGDGSCHVVVAGSHVLMFDCGSQNYPLIGRRSVVPGLRAIGVRKIDTLIISHSDLDHFGGVLDVVENVRVARILVPPQLLANAQSEEEGTTAFLLAELSRRNIPVEPIYRGWHSNQGDVTFRVHWPTPDFVAQRNNDTSVVLRITADRASLLLVGDIEGQAMHALLASGDDLTASVMELPHHGSFVEGASPAFLAAVAPSIVLQSSGMRSAIDDPWAAPLEAHHVRRMVTDMLGMIHLNLHADGSIETQSFLPPE